MFFKRKNKKEDKIEVVTPETRELLSKINTYEKSLHDRINAEKEDLRSQIKAYEKTIEKRADDIKGLIVLGNKLGSIGTERTYKMLREFEGDAISHELGLATSCQSYSNSYWSFYNYLVKKGGGFCGDYELRIYDDGSVCYYGAKFDGNSIDGLGNRLYYIKEVEARLDELMLKMKNAIEKL